jgi:hypothetical protein
VNDVLSFRKDIFAFRNAEFTLCHSDFDLRKDIYTFRNLESDADGQKSWKQKARDRSRAFAASWYRRGDSNPHAFKGGGF